KFFWPRFWLRTLFLAPSFPSCRSPWSSAGPKRGISCWRKLPLTVVRRTDSLRGLVFFQSQDCHRRPDWFGYARFGRRRDDYREGQRAVRQRGFACKGRAGAVYLELSQSRDPADDEDGLQFRRMPWSAGREEWLQADSARLRSGCGFRHADPAIRWTPRL